MPPKRQAKKGLAPKPVVKDKPEPVVKDKPEPEEDKNDALDRFPLELKWCIQQIELAMEKKKGPAKQAEDLVKSHKILTSSKASLIKKRQVMNSLYGDYRKKMSEEEKKFKIEQPKVKRKSTTPDKSIFLKKSHQKPCHHSDENKTPRSPEISTVDDFDGDTQHVQSEMNITCILTNDENSEHNFVQDSSKNRLKNDKDSMVLDNFKYKPSGNSFRFHFSAST